MRRPIKIFLAVCLPLALALGIGRIPWRQVKGLFDWRLKSTYPAGQAAASLKRMCAKDYHLTVEARRQGKTLQVFFWHIGLLKSDQFEMRPEAAHSLERVLLCATRIALSTDAGLQFIEIKTADVLTGATVTLWRYVPDIRDSMYTRMAEEEYVNRLVVEVQMDGKPEMMGRMPRWDPPITMAEFLAKQVVLRAKRQSSIGLQAHEDLSLPATLVVVVDNWPAIEEQGPKEKAKITELIERSAKTVLRGYRFSGFHGVVLEDGRGVALGSWKL